MTVVRWLDHFHPYNLQHGLPPPFLVRPLSAVIPCGRDHSMSKIIAVGGCMSNFLLLTFSNVISPCGNPERSLKLCPA